MDISEFLESQNKTLDLMRNFERDETRKIGIRPDPGLVNRRGGFFLSLMHEPEIVTKASKLSLEIGRRVPAVSYTNNELHTTAGSIPESQQDYFYYDEGMPTHRRFLDAVVNVANEVATEMRSGACQILFSEPYIIVPTCVVAPGQPNEAFIEIINTVKKVSEEVGVEFKLPWGAHMTLCRFTKTKKPEEVQALFHLLKNEAPFGLSRVTGIAAGYTLRRKIEEGATLLRYTRGPFHVEKFFPFR